MTGPQDSGPKLAKNVAGALRPYPEYKDSGVPWLGEIPSHWECSTLRRVARIQLSNVDKHTIDGEVPVRLCNYTDVYRRRFITPNLDFIKASALPREIEPSRPSRSRSSSGLPPTA